MLVTLDGIVIEVKADAFKNALSPMLVTLDGIVIEVKLDAPKNALSPILVTSVPTDTDFMLLIGMLLGTVRVPDVAAVVCVVPSVRVNVVGVAVFTTNVAVIVSEV